MTLVDLEKKLIFRAIAYYKQASLLSFSLHLFGGVWIGQIKKQLYASNECQLLRSRPHNTASNHKYITRANTKLVSLASFTRLARHIHKYSESRAKSRYP